MTEQSPSLTPKSVTLDKEFKIEEGNTVFIQVGQGKFDKYIYELGKLKVVELGIKFD